jgi:hypothetical protein
VVGNLSPGRTRRARVIDYDGGLSNASECYAFDLLQSDSMPRAGIGRALSSVSVTRSAMQSYVDSKIRRDSKGRKFELRHLQCFGLL